MSLSVNFLIVETYAPNFAVSASRGNKLASKIAIGPEELSGGNGLTARYSSLFSHSSRRRSTRKLEHRCEIHIAGVFRADRVILHPGLHPDVPAPCAFNI